MQQVSHSHVHNMASTPLAKPPKPLNLKDTTHQGEKWKQFRWDWAYYEMVSKINEEGPIQVAHLLNVIGKTARRCSIHFLCWLLTVVIHTYVLYFIHCWASPIEWDGCSVSSLCCWLKLHQHVQVLMYVFILTLLHLVSFWEIWKSMRSVSSVSLGRDSSLVSSVSWNFFSGVAAKRSHWIPIDWNSGSGTVIISVVAMISADFMQLHSLYNYVYTHVIFLCL